MILVIIPLIFLVLLFFFQSIVFYPINGFLIRLAIKLFHIKFHKKKELTPQLVIETLNDVAISETTEDEQQLMKGVARFGDIDVKEIMRSRMDITAVEITMSFDHLIQTVISSGYSRIPIYEGTIDQIKGIVYVKDLLPYTKNIDTKDWKRLIRKAWFITENKSISDLLHEFQEKHIHLAIVIDEFGGTTGIVTMEDILEEIVGEINDEYDNDTEDRIYHQLNEYEYLFEAKVTLNDFCKITDTEDNLFDDLPGDPDTLAGLILELAGRIPEAGFEVKFEKLDFVVESVDKRRIRRIRVKLPQVADTDE
jgi:gliding motility-associated protein GldE